MKIAILSDLHVGKKARAKDFCPQDVDSHAHDANYKRQFIDFVKEQNISVDYLVVSGDISCSSTLKEIELGADIVGSIASELNVKATFFVPGNHDRSWDLIRTWGDADQIMYDPLRRGGGVLMDSINAADGKLLEYPFFCVWELDDLVVVGVNSSPHDCPESIPHHGYVSSETIKELTNKLNEYRDRDVLKVLLLHHHPVPYSIPIPEDKDFSLVQNSDALMSATEIAEFDVIIHGHQHAPKMKFYSGNLNVPVVCVCAGSFSSQLEPRWAGHITNSFHILSVEGRCTNNSRMQGFVYSWSYTTIDKWRPSCRDSDGIDHMMPFGCCLQKSEVKKILIKELNEWFTKDKLIYVNQLIPSTPALKYVNIILLEQVVSELAQSIGFNTHTTKNNGLLLVKT